MSYRDDQRYRKVYSYFRPFPRPGDPTGGVDKTYVDESLRAIDWKQSVRIATSTTYVFDDIGPSIQGITLIDEDRVLLKSQTNPAENGIYIFDLESGTISRSLDADDVYLTCGATVYVEEGTYEKTIWTLTTVDPIDVGVTSQTWENVIGGSVPGGNDTEVQFNNSGVFGGSSNFTFDNTQKSLSQGDGVTATGQYSYAQGTNSIALGVGSHAEGSSTQAIGDWCHSEGGDTKADGVGSHAEGYGAETAATSNAAHASGYYVIASGSQIGQNVVGKYNKRENDFSLFVVGNGTGDANVNRSDIFRVNTSTVEVTGTLISTAGISGSLTRLPDGKSYLVAGTNVVITTGSTGQVTISAGGGGGGGIPGGSALELQYNDGAAGFAGATNLTWVSAEKRLAGINMSTTALTATYVSASYLTGSLTKLSDGTTDYLRAGSEKIVLTTGSNGQVTITNPMPEYFFSTTNGSIFTTGSAIFRGNLSDDSPSDKGSDVFFYVSGTVGQTGASGKVSVFGGDVYVSGTINANSISTVVGNWTVTTGSVTLPYTFLTGNYTAGSDYYMKCSGTFTLSLPTAAGIQGRTYVIKNFSSGTITVDPFSTQTIDGANSLSFSTQYTSYTIVSDGANWMIV